MTTRVGTAFTRLGVAVVACWGSAAEAGAQQWDAFRDPALREVARVEVAAAAARGLPLDPLMTKALEGQLKNAPPDRVRVALRALASRLDVARTALAPATDAELTAGADALSAGATPDVLTQMRRTWPGKSVAVPLGVLTELVARGIAPPRASKQVLALMARGASPQQLATLGNDVNADVRGGRGADAALDLRVRGIMGALAPPAGVTVVPNP